MVVRTCSDYLVVIITRTHSWCITFSFDVLSHKPQILLHDLKDKSTDVKLQSNRLMVRVVP
jgi:hypothetical protein